MQLVMDDILLQVGLVIMARGCHEMPGSRRRYSSSSTATGRSAGWVTATGRSPGARPTTTRGATGSLATLSLASERAGIPGLRPPKDMEVCYSQREAEGLPGRLTREPRVKPKPSRVKPTHMKPTHELLILLPCMERTVRVRPALYGRYGLRHYDTTSPPSITRSDTIRQMYDAHIQSEVH